MHAYSKNTLLYLTSEQTTSNYIVITILTFFSPSLADLPGWVVQYGGWGCIYQGDTGRDLELLTIQT